MRVLPYLQRVLSEKVDPSNRVCQMILWQPPEGVNPKVQDALQKRKLLKQSSSQYGTRSQA